MKLSNNIILPFAPEVKVLRARSIVGLKNTNYRLPYPNGGKDPRSAHPASAYNSPILKRLVNVCDCSGFTAWVQGYSRLQDGRGEFPAFPDTPSVAGGYINTDSMIEEALGFNRRKGLAPYAGGRWFSVLAHPIVGCIVVYHKRVDSSPLWKMNPKVGHVGVVTEVPAEQYEEKDREMYFKPNTRNHKQGIQVVHCSGVDKTGGTAVRETDGRIWAKKGALFLQFNAEYLLGLKKA